MYADFFGLRELPFNNTPDPRFFYSTPDHEEALASLVYTVEQRKGFVLLTGEVGTGKTLLTRMMLRRFGERIAFATINHAVRTTDDLLESVCTEFGLPVDAAAGPARCIRALHDFLLAKFAQDVPVVLVLDEAQSMPVAAFEQLRTVGNLEADDAKLLQIVIVGQPELQRRFTSPHLRQLGQRIFRSYHLPALTLDATEGYIHLRLSVAGGTDLDVFNADAVELIHQKSQGLPRLINTLCDNAMLSAYSSDRRRVDGPFMRSVIEQMVVLDSEGEARESGRLDSKDMGLGMPAGNEDWSPQARPKETQGEGIALDVIARRMHDLESRVRETRLADETAMRVRDAIERAVGAPGIRQGGGAFDPAFHVDMHKLGERLAAIEQELGLTVASRSRARGLREELDHACGQARSLLARLQARERNLADRETHLERLSDRMRLAIEQVRKSVIAVRTLGEESKRTQRLAANTVRELKAETAQARRMTGRIPHQPEVSAPVTMSSGVEATVLQESSKSGDSVSTMTTGPDRQAISDALIGARDTAADLRAMARAANIPDDSALSSSSGPTPSANTSTQRLARDVQGLLEMMSPAR